MTEADADLRVPSAKEIPSVRKILRGNPIKILLDAREKSSKIVRLRFGMSEYHLVMDPEMIQEVLVTKQSYFEKENYIGIFIPIVKVVQQGLIASPAVFEPHDKMRKLEQPAFHKERILTYARAMTDIGKSVSETWADGGIVDIHEAMVIMTTMVVARCLFGVDIGPESREVGRDLTTIAGYYERLASPVSSLLVRLPSNKKFAAAAARTSDLFRRLADERRRSGERPDDLLTMLLEARNEAGMGMTDGQMHDQLGLFFVVGHETSANALAWLWYLLSQNPKAEAKLHEEVDQLFPNYEVPTVDDVPKLTYTMKLVYETLRVYPSAWSIVRSASKECQLGEYRIPAGGNVWISQYLNNRNPSIFAEPDRFNPERWTEEFTKSLPPFSFFPFGGGARRCMGESFAWMEISLLVATLARRWRMTLAPGQKVVPQTGISLRPKFGLKMRVEKR